MPKKAKERIAEQRYIKRARELAAAHAVKSRAKTPWKDFFHSGVGATIDTELTKTSVRAIITNYGKKLGKRFVCSFDEKEDRMTVKIESEKRRDDENCCNC